MREYFMKSDRLCFSRWSRGDEALAKLLWGDPQVTRFICASGLFSEEEIRNRLETEIAGERRFGVQYWPVFYGETGELAGCCGLRPYGNRTSEDGEKAYELGFHFRPLFWGRGLAEEAARKVIEYGFEVMDAAYLAAGHHPLNLYSERLLSRLGFRCVGTEFYGPTGLMHPSYRLERASE